MRAKEAVLPTEQNNVTQGTQQEEEEKTGRETLLIRPPLTMCVIHGERERETKT